MSEGGGREDHRIPAPWQPAPWIPSLCPMATRRTAYGESLIMVLRWGEAGEADRARTCCDEGRRD